MAELRLGPNLALTFAWESKIKRLFTIKTRWEAYIVIYAFAVGAVERGSHYLTQYPGFGGKMLFLACTGSVLIGGAKILDAIRAGV